MTPESPSSNGALSPEAMLNLADSQQRYVQTQRAAFVPKLYTLWGLVWFLGFGALWLIDGISPGLDLAVAIGIFVGLLAIGILVSIALGLRARRHGRPDFTPAAFTGMVYGLGWPVGGIAIPLFAQGLRANGMSGELLNIFYPVAFVLFTGVMYMLAGGIWHSVSSLVLGLWVLTVGLAAPFFGYPTHYLILALGGGGGLIGMGAVNFAQLARARRRARRTQAVDHG